MYFSNCCSLFRRLFLDIYIRVIISVICIYYCQFSWDFSALHVPLFPPTIDWSKLTRISTTFVEIYRVVNNVSSAFNSYWLLEKISTQTERNIWVKIFLLVWYRVLFTQSLLQFIWKRIYSNKNTYCPSNFRYWISKNSIVSHSRINDASAFLSEEVILLPIIACRKNYAREILTLLLLLTNKNKLFRIISSI